MKLYNTPTRQMESLNPITPGKVTLYTCGPTVYDNLHVGNWTAYIYWDVLVRTLQASDLTVERVMNITDVGHLVSDEDEGQDKIEIGAQRENKTAWEIAKFYSDNFITDLHELNLIMPTHLTKATDYIPQQLELVRVLKEKGYTYEIDDGIYFDTSKFPRYADFAHLDLDNLRGGARVALNNQKRQPNDFALWKFTPSGTKRDMEWQTPMEVLDNPRQVMGFPGWHLECSAMALNILGNTIDIHTGGIDHIPVHHTNEIAQSEAATGVTFANMWLHNNHLKVNGVKISKSLANGYTLTDISSRGFSPLDFKLLVLQSHYQTEGNFTFENLESARNRLLAWRNVAALRHQTYLSGTNFNGAQTGLSLLATPQAILEAIQNNLDTPSALKIIDEAFGAVESASLVTVSQYELKQLLEEIDNLLGLNLLETTPDISDDAKQIILERQNARNNKDWDTSDQLRKKLINEHSINLLDSGKSSTWQYVN